MNEEQIKLVATIMQVLKAQQPAPKTASDTFLEVGKSYFIRTVTYHAVGKLVAINPQEFLLEDASWVADSGRFHDALKTGALNEVEPFVKPAIISRGAFVDASEWHHPLPKEVK